MESIRTAFGNAGFVIEQKASRNDERASDRPDPGTDHLIYRWLNGSLFSPESTLAVTGTGMGADFAMERESGRHRKY